MALVVAEYNEFDGGMPSWAQPTIQHPYCVAPVYQRIDEKKPYYVPNQGYEGSVYLKFVVDYYDNLPDITVFMQADASRLTDIQERLDILANNADKVQYQPMNVNYKAGSDTSQAGDAMTFIAGRPSTWEAWGGGGEERDTCYKHIMKNFGAPDIVQNSEEPDAPIVTSLYCCNYFAVSRDLIRRIPFETWRSTYEDFAVKGKCTPDLGDPNGWGDKWINAIALEHMSAVMFGGKPANMQPACGEEYVMQDQACPDIQRQAEEEYAAAVEEAKNNGLPEPSRPNPVYVSHDDPVKTIAEASGVDPDPALEQEYDDQVKAADATMPEQPADAQATEDVGSVEEEAAPAAEAEAQA